MATKSLTINSSNVAPSSLQQTIPGLSTATNQASSNILNLLGGLPSTSQARTTNAYWGVGAGQPATGGIGTFIGNRGTDLYGQQAQQNNQTGLSNLLSLIGGYSGTVSPTAPQLLQNQQFNSQLAQNQNQFDATNALNEFNSQLNALSVLGNLMNQGRSNPFASVTPTSF